MQRDRVLPKDLLWNLHPVLPTKRQLTPLTSHTGPRQQKVARARIVRFSFAAGLLGRHGPRRAHHLTAVYQPQQLARVFLGQTEIRHPHIPVLID